MSANEVKYRFNCGDAVKYTIRGPGVDNTSFYTIDKCQGKWCWLFGAGDHKWNAFDRMTGKQRENPIPRFSAHIELAKEKRDGL